MKISILSYSFHGLLRDGMQDLSGYLETCRYRYHLNTADLWSGHFASLDDDYIAKVRRALRDREMDLVDIAVDKAHIWEDDQDLRSQHEQRARRFLEIAAALGAKFVRIDAGGSRETLKWTDEQFDFIAKRYREYAQFAHDHGFKVGIENHWGPEKVFSNLKKMYDAVDHPAFSVSCHLSSWAGPEEEQAQADALCAPIAGHTHLAWYVCEGPLEEKLRMLKKAGYPGYYSVEHHSAEEEYHRTAIQLARVREVLTRLDKEDVS